MAQPAALHYLYDALYQHGGAPYTACGAEVRPVRPAPGYYGFVVLIDRTTRQADDVTCRNCRKSLSRNRYAPAA